MTHNTVSDENKIEQSRKARMEFDNTVRVVRAQNGFVVKTPQGQFVYGSLSEMLIAVGKFFTPKS